VKATSSGFDLIGTPYWNGFEPVTYRLEGGRSISAELRALLVARGRRRAFTRRSYSGGPRAFQFQGIS
jgi:hypothetical protein